MVSSSLNNGARGRTGRQFLEAGYVIAPAEDRAALDSIRQRTAAAAADALGIPLPNDLGGFLDRFHEQVEVARLNEVRLAILTRLLNDGDFRMLYLACGRSLVEAIAGTELAMQRTMGLSIQLPGDDSSLLPLHSDTWGSECSPFEVVLWIPLVDCARTKSMFILPPGPDRAWRRRLAEFEQQGTEALFNAVEPELVWTDIKYGDVMVFTPTLMHGNRVNRETTTRWSFNIRFKGLFTPYANKTLGEYFTPVSVTPASRIGLDFELPEGSHG
jgi:sporadic carbohydrate cluster 2OG-Fe(II) oxygenase